MGLWVARAPGGEFVYANRMFAEIMGQGGRDDAQVGGYSEPYGILTRDGRPYPEDRLPFVRAQCEQALRHNADLNEARLALAAIAILEQRWADCMKIASAG